MYDYVFAEDSTQDEVYQTTTSPLIKDVLKGYSAAVFAYGATGSGKYFKFIPLYDGSMIVQLIMVCQS